MGAAAFWVWPVWLCPLGPVASGRPMGWRMTQFSQDSCLSELPQPSLLFALEAVTSFGLRLASMHHLHIKSASALFLLASSN